jgi:hypothetical protein
MAKWIFVKEFDQTHFRLVRYQPDRRCGGTPAYSVAKTLVFGSPVALLLNDSMRRRTRLSSIPVPSIESGFLHVARVARR